MKVVLGLAVAVWLGLFAWAAWGAEYNSGDDVGVSYFCTIEGAKRLFAISDRDAVNSEAQAAIDEGVCVYTGQPIPAKLTTKIDGPKLVIGKEGALEIELWEVDFGGFKFYAIFANPMKGTNA